MELTLDEALKKGIKAHKSGQIHEADKIYTAILQVHPNHSQANHNMGILALSIDKTQEALPFFKTAVEANPNINQFWLSYIDALIKLGKITDARVVFNQAKEKGIEDKIFDQLERRIDQSDKSVGDPASASIGAVKKSQDPAFGQIQSLINLYDQGKLMEASDQAAELLNAFPRSLTLHNIYGAVNNGLGKFDAAIDSYKQTLKISPTFAAGYYNIGVALKGKGHLDEAIVSYKRALQINPEYADALRGMGNALTTNGDLDAALGSYREALRISPDSAQLYNDIGNVLQEKGEQNKAIDSYKRAIEIRPDYAEVFNNMGTALRALGYLDDAMASYKQAFKIKPDYAEAYNNIGNCFKESGDIAGAIENYKQALLVNSNFDEAYNNLGLALKDKGELDAAIDCFKQALRVNPSYAKAYSNLGIALKDLGQFHEAIESYDRAITIDPSNFEAHSNRANVLKEIGELEAAADSCRNAIKINPESAEAYNNLGIILNDKGELGAAIECYRQALRIKPTYAEAYNNFGIVLKDKGDLDAAIGCYRQAIKIKPDVAEIHSNMGIALISKGELGPAVNSYKKALEINPNYTPAAWNLSGTAKSIAESKNWLQLCLNSDPNNVDAILTIAALEFYEGDTVKFHDLMNSSLKDHPYMRTFMWAFSLPELPEIHFYRWALFDRVIEKSIKDRPFYEFGVWRGEAFQYLIKTFKKGYGFDTFEGIPEDWHEEKVGAYSNDGNIPEIEGGEFVVGKFEDSLPAFFSEPRPAASVINFDADLYSSTICALNFAKSVIDQHTILIFDEFIINKNWEQDEYKALNEFCTNNNYSYEVLALSFFTKQVAVRLIGI